MCSYHCHCLHCAFHAHVAGQRRVSTYAISLFIGDILMFLSVMTKREEMINVLLSCMSVNEFLRCDEMMLVMMVRDNSGMDEPVSLSMFAYHDKSDQFQSVAPFILPVDHVLYVLCLYRCITVLCYQSLSIACPR